MVEIKNVKVSNIDDTIKRIKNSYTIGNPEYDYKLSDKDTSLATRLGSDLSSHQSHDAWLKGIIVSFDIKLNFVIQAEFQRYHFIEIIMQQSRVHSLKKLFNEDYNPFTKYVTDESKTIARNLCKKWIDNPSYENYEILMHNIPMGLELWASCVTNYLQLKTILIQRYNHPHKEDWGEICKFIHNLPKFDYLTGLGDLK